MTLRVPAHRAAASLGLSEKRLEVGEGLAIGGGEVKAFVPSPTLYSGRVASTAGDDRAFHDEVARWLDAVGIHGEIISGRPRRLAAGGQEVLAYGLALHGLSPADSVRVQGEGLGPHRRLGCGIFVPHKAIAVPD
jgi:CRISPR-associated protein Cas6